MIGSNWIRIPLVFVLFVPAVTLLMSRERDLFSLLSSSALLGKQTDGTYLVATNQMIRPWEQQWLLKGRPVEIAFDSKKKLLAVLNTRGVHLVDGSTGVELARMPSSSTSYTGLAFRPGNREIWASEATRSGPDSLMVTALSEAGLPEKTARLALPGHPVPTGIAFLRGWRRRLGRVE